MGEPEDEKGSANSELRYITLELMKIANSRKTTFRKIAAEYMENAYSLAEMLQAMPYPTDSAQGGKKEKGSTQRQDDKE